MLSWCIRCRLHTCLCGEIPRLETRTQFVIIRHVFERTRPSNTAHFAQLALGCPVLPYGGRGAPFDESRLPLEGTALLFPGAPELPRELPGRLIVLDGSWSQAKHMRQRLRALHGLPLLSLVGPRRPMRPRLRRPQDGSAMSTLEAMAAAVALLEGAERAEPLERLHDQIVATKRPANWPSSRWWR